MKLNRMKNNQLFLAASILLAFTFQSIVALAQAPQKVSYQMVVRDASGELVRESTVGVKISILQGSASGTAVYVETHTPQSNVNGLVSIEVGNGTPVTNTFAGIDWTSCPYFLKVETDPSGRTSYTITGTTEILSVPYALHAKTAESVNGTVTGEGNVLFTGEYKSSSPGAAPASGTGTRMMWYPDKAAFRAGGVNGANWDTDSIGNYSVGFGYNTKAKGSISTAMGCYTTASGAYSTAMGNQTTASGDYSTAMGGYTTASGGSSAAIGYNTTASGSISTAMGGFTTASGHASTAMGRETSALGNYSTAMGIITTASGHASTAMGQASTASGNYSTTMGYCTTASGEASTAMGGNTIAHSGYETVIGRYNTDYTPANTTDWNSADRLFVIGNGTSFSSRSNAITVLKNGNTGIGTDTPGELLHVRNAGGAARIRIAAAENTLAEINFFQGGTYKGAIGYDNTSENIYIYHGGNIIFKNGRIGIQSVTNPTYAIELPNDATIGTGLGRAYAWTTYSDKRIKSDVKEINYGIDDVLKLKPVSYLQHNSTTENGKIVIDNNGVNNIGFIAQDVYKIIPEIVNKPENEENTLWSMSYEKLAPVLVKAIQEQQGIIEELQKQNASMQKQIDELKALIKQ